MPIPKDQRPQYDNVFLLLFWVYQTLFLGKTTNQMDCPYVLFITLADIDLHIRFWMLRIHHTECMILRYYTLTAFLGRK